MGWLVAWVPTILPRLRDTRKSHSGESIAEEVLREINDHGIGENVQYFKGLERQPGNPPKASSFALRSPFINLVAKAVLYGTEDMAS